MAFHFTPGSVLFHPVYFRSSGVWLKKTLVLFSFIPRLFFKQKHTKQNQWVAKMLLNNTKKNLKMYLFCHKS